MDQSREIENRMRPQILCQVCQHEVPLSEAAVSEAVDYMAYFCGLDCYTAWRARANALTASGL